MQSVIDRIRKILAKTEQAGCTKEEAALALQTASRLMAEHNLDMAEIEAGGTGEPSWIEDDVLSTGRWTLEQNLAYGIVKNFFFVEGFFGWKQGKKVLRFFGAPDNVATGKWAFGALTDAFGRLFSEYRRASGAPASERRIFVSGVADGFRRKMEDERKAMEIERDIVHGKASGSTALAVIGVKERTVAAYRESYQRLFKKNGKAKRGHGSFSAVTGSNSALEAGYRAGQSLNLNRAVAGNRQKAIPGS